MWRTSREKTAEDRAKVVKYFMKNPNARIREVAELLSVPSASVQRYIKEYKEDSNKDPRMVAILSKDLDIVTKWQQIIEEKLNDPEQVARMKASEISSLTSESAKRYQLLWGINNQESNTYQAIQVNISLWDE